MEINYQSVVDSLSGSEGEIIEYLPYLLQDFWELGGGTERLTELLDRNLSATVPSSKVLELCCGKGAVLNSIVQKYKCKGKGIDLFEPFIKEAREKSVLNQTTPLPEYEVMDIKDAVKILTDYDIVIYCGDTDVLGNETESLKQVSQCCKTKGYLLYESASKSLEGIYQPIRENGLQIIDEIVAAKKDIAEINKANNDKIKLRAGELINNYPAKKELFENYIILQEKESLELENELILVSFLLRKV